MSETDYKGFERHTLAGEHAIFEGDLPSELLLGGPEFQALWDMHPEKYPTAVIHGRDVELPRWQFAFDRDYAFTGQKSEARPRPALLDPLLSWVKEAIDSRLNGILVNGYEASEQHYIGPHRDEVKDLVEGSPIVTVSFGEGRLFRIRPWKGKTQRTDADFRFLDFPVENGNVIVLPSAVNERFTHEVPHHARCKRRRLSVTFRAFQD